MFSAMELNLQEAGGPERQCDHLPVREQGDVRFYEFLQKPCRNPFFWGGGETMWGADCQGFIPPPPFSHAPCHPRRGSKGGRVECNKEHWIKMDKLKVTHTPPPSQTKGGSKDTAKKLFKSDKRGGGGAPLYPPKETCTKGD